MVRLYYNMGNLFRADMVQSATDSITALKNVTTGIVIPVIYSVIFLLGIVGNSMVIYFTFIKDGVSKNPVRTSFHPKHSVVTVPSFNLVSNASYLALLSKAGFLNLRRIQSHYSE